MKVESAIFIAKAEEIAAEGQKYVHGGDGSNGECDCIGLIIGAIRRAGGQWRGLHGSNYAARNEMDTLEPLSGTGQLKPGEVVYKAWDPDQGGYELPPRYLPGGDHYNGEMRDFYHIGIVESVYPLRIRHMTYPKMKMDTSIGKWNFHGKLKKISEDGGEKKKMETVTIRGGNEDAPIHMRKSPSTSAAIIADIPQGSVAFLNEGGGVWSGITWDGKNGYVMSTFIHRDEGDGGEKISVSRKELEQIYDKLGDLLGLRG